MKLFTTSCNSLFCARECVRVKSQCSNATPQRRYKQQSNTQSWFYLIMLLQGIYDSDNDTFCLPWLMRRLWITKPIFFPFSPYFSSFKMGQNLVIMEKNPPGIFARARRPDRTGIFQFPPLYTWSEVQGSFKINVLTLHDTVHGNATEPANRATFHSNLTYHSSWEWKLKCVS